MFVIGCQFLSFENESSRKFVENTPQGLIVKKTLNHSGAVTGMTALP